MFINSNPNPYECLLNLILTPRYVYLTLTLTPINVY